MLLVGSAALVLSATVGVSGAGAINHGNTAAPGSWPSIVALVDNRLPSLKDGFFCGGSIIDPHWVVTAAHCAAPFHNSASVLTLVSGREDLNATSGGQLLSVDRVVVNPAFDEAVVANDVALLHLSTPAKAPAIPLMTGNVEPDYDTGRVDGKIAGWGTIDPGRTTISPQLQEAHITLLPDSECTRIYDVFAPGKHICGAGGATTTCAGDSGGPLIVQASDGTVRLAGLVDFGLSDCEAAPSAFTRVSAQVPWILSVIGGTGAPAPSPGPGPTPGSPGYWMLGQDGRVFPFGAAADFGQAAGHLGAAVATAIAPTPDDKGYWVVSSTGAVSAFGDAGFFGSVQNGALARGETVTTIAVSPTGQGYYLFTSAGRVLVFGDAVNRGDMTGKPLNGPVLGAVLTPTGNGYYMVGSDGGIFSFGDAVFHGSMGGQHLNAPVRSLVPTADGSGYWLVASDGGIFAFNAPFRGSMGGQHLNRPIVGMVRYGDGYLMVASDGGIFNFSDTPFVGSLGANPPAQPIVGVAAVSG